MADRQPVTLVDEPALIERRERTSEGYLRATAAISKVGIVDYVGKEIGLDGSDANRIVRVYRPAETVFSDETKTSARMKPVTLGHPPRGSDVVPGNHRAFAVGNLGDDVRALDERRLGSAIMVTNDKAIAAIEAGTVQTSAGFSTHVKAEAGEYRGERYDYITDGPMLVNHLAIVPRGRAGEDVRIFDARKDAAMDEDQVKALIDEAIKGLALKDAKAEELDALRDKLSAVVTETVAAAVKGATDAQPTDDADKAGQAAKEGAGGDDGENDDTGAQGDDEAKAREQQLRDAARARARLILDTADLLPKDAKVDEMGTREILVAALKDVVTDPDKRSEEYLLGVLGTVAGDRQAAASARARMRDDADTDSPRKATKRTPRGVMALRDMARRNKK